MTSFELGRSIYIAHLDQPQRIRLKRFLERTTPGVSKVWFPDVLELSISDTTRRREKEKLAIAIGKAEDKLGHFKRRVGQTMIPPKRLILAKDRI